MKYNPEEYFWNEKYRPITLNDIIIPERFKTKFKTVIETGEIPGYIFSGLPGTGKSSTARALCEMLDLEYKHKNASEERGIALARYIEDYGVTCSFNGKYKVVILEEGEKLTVDCSDALKDIEEKLKSNLRLIITTNNFNKIDSALASRLVHIRFDMSIEEKKEIFPVVLNRIYNIFDIEGVKYNKDNNNLKRYIANVIKQKSDIRHILKTLQEIATENNMKMPDDYDFPDDIITFENFTKMLNSDYQTIVRFADKTDPLSVFIFVGRNVLNFSEDMNTIRKIMNITVSHERCHHEKIDKLNNMIAYLLNLREIIK